MSDKLSNQIVVVGSCMIDFVSYAPKLPIAGETVLGTKFQTGFGGKGANQCVAAAKLGGSTTLIARLGDDTWGQNYLKQLTNLNVDTSFVQITLENHSGIAQITVDDHAQNQIVVVGGANGKLCVDDVEKASEALEKAAVVICQLETSVDVALAAINKCKGVSILNGAPALSNCDRRLLTAPSIFCVNETEAAVFTGLDVNNIEEAKIAVKNLHEKGAQSVILTLGAEGALFSTKNSEKVTLVPSTKVAPVDTTGAGDAFIGALAYLLANYREFSMEKTIEIACKMAASSVTKPGTQTSFPDESIIKNLL